MLAIRLTKETDGRLARLARGAGRTKADYARAALLAHLEEVEDARLAADRLAHPAKIHSAREVKRALGL